MTPRPVFRRRRYLIKKGLQFRYIGIIFALAMAASVVTGYTVFATGWTLLGEKLANVYPQGRLLYVFKAVNFALLRNLLLVSPFVFLLALFFSHKIAGPVYRIEKSINEIAKGNLELRISLRRGDELQDLAEMINVMTERFRNTITLSKEADAQIQKELDDIRKAIASEPCDRAKIKSSIATLQSKLSNMASSLNQWTTTAS